MHECMKENGMTFSSEEINELVDAIFEDANIQTTSDGISFQVLRQQLSKHEGLLDDLSIT